MPLDTFPFIPNTTFMPGISKLFLLRASLDFVGHVVAPTQLCHYGMQAVIDIT